MKRPARSVAIVAAVVAVASLLTVPASQPASAAPSAITVTSPIAGQVVQRDRGGATADVRISGTVVGGGPVEASFDGVTWKRLTSTGTAFTGVLADQPVGRRNLLVRSAQAPAVSATVPAVGVGDVFAVMGDSNAVGAAPTMQVYSGPPGQVSMFTHNRVWRTLTRDPVDNADEDAPFANCRWVFIWCAHHALYDSISGGSPWPRVATLLAAAQPGLPIGLVVLAKNASGLNCDPAVPSTTCWQKPSGAWGSDPYASLYTDALERLRAQAPAGGVRAILWFEGVNDSGAAASSGGRARYVAYVKRFVSDLVADYGPVDVVVSSPGDCDPALMAPCAGRDLGLDNVRAGVADVWASAPGVVRGPVLYDIDKSGGDGIHYRTQASIDLAAARIAGSLRAAYYGGPSQAGPALVAVAGDARKVRVTFDRAALVPGASVGGITVERNGVAAAGQKATAVSNREVDVSLSGQAGALTVSVAAGRSGRQPGIVRDASGLPADPMIRVAVGGTAPPAPAGPVNYISGQVGLAGGGSFAANVRPADLFRLRGIVNSNGVGYFQRDDVIRCGTSCVQGSAFMLFRPDLSWRVDLAARTVSVNGTTKAITSGMLTIS